MINIEDRHFKILREILERYPYRFYAFGSRVNNKNKKFSDLDLCFKDDIPDAEVFKLKADLESSNIPFFVDIVNWDKCSDDFKKLIENEMVEIC